MPQHACDGGSTHPCTVCCAPASDKAAPHPASVPGLAYLVWRHKSLCPGMALRRLCRSLRLAGHHADFAGLSAWQDTVPACARSSQFLMRGGFIVHGMSAPACAWRQPGLVAQFSTMEPSALPGRASYPLPPSMPDTWLRGMLLRCCRSSSGACSSIAGWSLCLTAWRRTLRSRAQRMSWPGLSSWRTRS